MLDIAYADGWMAAAQPSFVPGSNWRRKTRSIESSLHSEELWSP
jgi:hypothetical protein